MADVIRELVVRLSYEVDSTGLEKFEQGTTDAKEGAEELGKGVDAAGVKTVALGGIIANGATALAKFAAQAVKAAAAFAVDLVTGFAETGDEIAKTSRQIGIGAESLQRLRFAAERSGVGSEQLQASLKKLQVGLVEAREKGTGPTQEGLDLLGVTLEDLPADDTEAALGILADAFGDLESETERTAIASKLFGEDAGPKLKTLLDEGSAGIKALGDEAESLGGVLGEDALASAESLTDGFTNLQTAFDGAKNQIGAALAPAITDLITLLTDLLKENEDLIQQDIPDLFRAAAKVIPPVIKFTTDLVDSVAFLVRETQQWTKDADKAGTTGNALAEIFRTLTLPIRTLIDLIGKAIEGLDGLADRVNVLGAARDRVQSAFGFQRQTGEFATDETTNQRVSARNVAAAAQQRAAGRDVTPEQLQRAQDQITRGAAQAGQAITSGLGAAARFFGVDEESQRRADRASQRAAIRRSARRRGGGGGGRARPAAAATTPAAEAPLPGLESLTTDDTLGALLTGDDSVAGGRSRPLGRAGGGEDALAGAQIVRIDASFNAPTTVNVNVSEGDLQGLSPGGTAASLGGSIADVLDTRNREAFDTYRKSVRP